MKEEEKEEEEEEEEEEKIEREKEQDILESSFLISSSSSSSSSSFSCSSPAFSGEWGGGASTDSTNSATKDRSVSEISVEVPKISKLTLSSENVKNLVRHFTGELSTALSLPGGVAGGATDTGGLHRVPSTTEQPPQHHSLPHFTTAVREKVNFFAAKSLEGVLSERVTAASTTARLPQRDITGHHSKAPQHHSPHHSLEKQLQTNHISSQPSTASPTTACHSEPQPSLYHSGTPQPESRQGNEF
ncbi:hypothetical protein E2C01_074061 [Portunus trituberculatus]|uniref:Uncharacterized protein n=1 Tax=Portunus trituberculatus TaxID=210409 RepID=A0A5B7I720_PORTR|nr:hypothetical protein [Portunus trituberculatus]